MATFKNVVTGNTVTATNPIAVSLMERSDNYIKVDKKSDKKADKKADKNAGEKNEGKAE